MSLELNDLSTFFACEPTVDAGDNAWKHAGAAFRYVQAEDDVFCNLAPGKGELYVVWRQDGIKRVELSLEGYFEVRLEHQHGVQCLLAQPSQTDRAPLILQLKPYVLVALRAN